MLDRSCCNRLVNDRTQLFHVRHLHLQIMVYYVTQQNLFSGVIIPVVIPAAGCNCW